METKRDHGPYTIQRAWWSYQFIWLLFSTGAAFWFVDHLLLCYCNVNICEPPLPLLSTFLLYFTSLYFYCSVNTSVNLALDTLVKFLHDTWGYTSKQFEFLQKRNFT